MTPYLFNPVDSAFPPWQSQMTLDGSSYKAVAYWNLYGQRWYVTLYNTSGAVVWTGPIIGSPDDYDIPLAPGIFSTSTLVYRVSTSNFEVS